jgi:hypothetical protein
MSILIVYCGAFDGQLMGKIGKSHQIITGWWFGTMEFYDFPFSWE